MGTIRWKRNNLNFLYGKKRFSELQMKNFELRGPLHTPVLSAEWHPVVTRSPLENRHCICCLNTRILLTHTFLQIKCSILSPFFN